MKKASVAAKRRNIFDLSSNKAGFTMVELLAAIVILGVLYLIYTVFFQLTPKPEDLTNKGTVFASSLYKTYSVARNDESLSMDTVTFEKAVETFAAGKTPGGVKTLCMANPVFETSGNCSNIEALLKVYPTSRFKISAVPFSTVKANYLNDAGNVKFGNETLADDARVIQVCFEQKDAKSSKRKNICGGSAYDAGQKFLAGWVDAANVTY